jgi:hypothetical protein
MENNMESSQSTKKTYVAPVLTEYGNLEKLTLGAAGGNLDVGGTTPMACL